MTFRELTCPRCHAPLPVEPGGTAVCAYCGAVVRDDDRGAAAQALAAAEAYAAALTDDETQCAAAADRFYALGATAASGGLVAARASALLAGDPPLHALRNAAAALLDGRDPHGGDRRPAVCRLLLAYAHRAAAAGTVDRFLAAGTPLAGLPVPEADRRSLAAEAAALAAAPRDGGDLPELAALQEAVFRACVLGRGRLPADGELRSALLGVDSAVLPDDLRLTVQQRKLAIWTGGPAEQGGLGLRYAYLALPGARLAALRRQALAELQAALTASQ